MGFAPFGQLNIPLRDEGTESVTVPAGTWPDARKYAGTFRDGTSITFWVVQDIPVPVRYQILTKYLDGEDPVRNNELRERG